ncbi:nicotinamide mononucleotide transporter [Methanobacterium formicicum]|uniref:Nicotinamide mononucleotide transporter n=1 Tax=Methanobacterium formicicum TaxID=2162 RepID=A0A843AN36_METFO|nr:nicotinamide mononucleotide transporter [Methanobacterium formicicum]MBF4474560.1 nicotinamide mononucleotide transporter [Methanobacterium formicicum]
MIDFIYWILTGLGLIGVILNIRHDRRCFFIWLLSNAGFAIQTYIYGVWNMTILFVIYFILAGWGVYSWKGKSQNEVREEI